MKKYTIVDSSYIDNLEIEVNKKLQEGYELLGGVSVADSGRINRFLQSMYKIEEKEEN
jgi:hypothetical protein